MNLAKNQKIRALIYSLAFVAIASIFVSWDKQRLNDDFDKLYSLLRTARLDALNKDTTIIVKFNGSTVSVANQKDSVTTTTTIPLIAKVDYETHMGNDMIVYTWRGTSDYNRKIHGGEIVLKSLLGFRRYIRVNCNGMVREGRYPEDG
jgi:Tfp pilus assembly protein FimT